MSDAPSYRPSHSSPDRKAVLKRVVALSQPFVAAANTLPSHFQRSPSALDARPVSDFTAPVESASPLSWSGRSLRGRSPYETNIHQRSPTRRIHGSFTAIARAVSASRAGRRADGSNESGLP